MKKVSHIFGSAKGILPGRRGVGGYILRKFNFGGKFREWVQMLFKYAQDILTDSSFLSNS
jgi:hypothetical protein